jgi:hypothetical protein
MSRYDRETFDVARMLRDAARSISTACVQRDDGYIDERLGQFKWSVIVGSLEEVAVELDDAAAFLEDREPWETASSVCGYEAWHAERAYCHHQSCFEQQESILVASAMQEQARELLTEWAHEDEEE